MRSTFIFLAVALLIGCKKRSVEDDDPAPTGKLLGVVLRPSSPDERWADPLPGVPRAESKVGVRMPAGTPSVNRFVFGGGEDGFVGLVSYNLQNEGVRVDVARTATGQAVGTVDVNFTPDGVMALSPDGKWLAVTAAGPFVGHPVTLYSTTRRGAEKKFTPYATAKDGTRAPDLAWVGFAAPDQLVTVNARSGFDVWSVPDLRRLAGQPGRPAASTPYVSSAGIGYSPQNLALSPDGRTLALFDGTAFTFYDTATAAPKVRTEPILQPGGSANFWASAMSADGKRFACLCSVYSPKGRTALLVWDPATGKRLSTTPVREESASGFGWWGPDHLALFTGGETSVDVLSVKAGRVVAYVERKGLAAVKIAAATPGDKLWYAFDGSGLDPGGAAPVLVKVPAPPSFRENGRYTVGPEGFRDR